MTPRTEVKTNTTQIVQEMLNVTLQKVCVVRSSFIVYCRGAMCIAEEPCALQRSHVYCRGAMCIAEKQCAEMQASSENHQPGRNSTDVLHSDP